ncbi:hypothetical protein POM88_013952 [Heracleum sosnowskyi]|uniref:NAC domain-containing protein n=1 Tax=Heracleum sosnowskyi TaxID=360622 RepID=A0AAD8J068_9APIA|nr:hypothetical protein POM88_013952 [Heracleum sosnowskyi]
MLCLNPQERILSGPNAKKAAAEKKKMVSKYNYVKKAGFGTWDGQTKRYEIRDCNGDLIGEKRFLVFEINDDSDQDLGKVGYWKMHEYHLRGVNEELVIPVILFFAR